MPIREYIDSVTGKTTWSVRVTSSSSDKLIRLERKKTGIENKAEAKKLETKLKNELIREVTIKENNGTTWKRLVNEFSDAMQTGKGLDKPLSPSTIDDYCSLFNVYTKNWDNVSVKNISRTDIKKVIDKMEADGKSYARRKKLKSLINAVFEYAILNEKVTGITQSPAYGFKLGRAEESRPLILTLCEVKKLLELAHYYEHEWLPIWATALLSGMRCGELYALKWDNVDFETRRIHVTVSYERKSRTTKSTKGGYWRDVPINSDLEVLLRELKPKTLATGYVLPRVTDWYRGEQSRVLRKFCLETGITPVTFHALRACWATMLLRDNVAPVTVMKMGGWKSLKTMQYYIRLAGIEVEGGTDTLNLLSMDETAEKIVYLFKK